MNEPNLPAGRWTDHSKTLTFTFNGQNIPATAGQSIGAALHAAGQVMISRSFKYHRPRGLQCMAGDCGNCLVRVGDRPNVKACLEPVAGGEMVESQNAWPGLGFDVLRAVDYLHRFFPVGFYYKRFHKPRWAWPFFERMLRRVAGLGIIDLEQSPEGGEEVEHYHPDICVVGGGPAGLAAAHAAAEAGASVILLETMPRLGGHALYGADDKREPDASLAGPRERLLVFLSTTAFGVYPANLVAAKQLGRLLKIRARHVILATGSRQQSLIYPNNDLPGTLLGRAVQRLVRLYGVRPGKRGVIVTDNDEGIELSHQLRASGVPIAAVVDRRPADPSVLLSEEYLPAHAVVAARGNRRVKGLVVAPCAPGGGSVGPKREIPCDFVCLVASPVPANDLARQAGIAFGARDGRVQPLNEVAGITLAGEVAGQPRDANLVPDASLCGAEAAASLGFSVANLERMRGESRNRARSPSSSTSLLQPEAVGSGKRFICLCEDVTVKDLEQAVAEGFDHIETLKRYSTFGMGACQGKSCSAAAAEACSRIPGFVPSESPFTTARPPAGPVELGTLAADSHHPVRRTPLHSLHQNAGARWLDAGQWKRPESYGDPAEEVRAVREAVGIIDVSTLGKFEILGPDAAEFMDRVYINRWSNLGVQRVRYGALCNEDGILFDDGVGARIGPEQFYLTTTTAGAEGAWQWFSFWQTTWKLRVTILNHTSSLTAINVAGPRSRELLGKLTALDMSNTGFPYMSARDGTVAGVVCRILRVGFVGEIGYEVHCSNAHAWHLWKAISDAGLRQSMKPFGVEAQRILRLEKGHPIIGQDTDALSGPLEAGMEKLVHFDKPRFLGKEAIEKRKAQGVRDRLVGFTVSDKKKLPLEGCQVVAKDALGRRPIGRVTSSRWSPTLGKGVGLAWIPAELAESGAGFAVVVQGVEQPMEQAKLPFHDAEGLRLRG